MSRKVKLNNSWVRSSEVNYTASKDYCYKKTVIFKCANQVYVIIPLKYLRHWCTYLPEPMLSVISRANSFSYLFPTTTNCRSTSWDIQQ